MDTSILNTLEVYLPRITGEDWGDQRHTGIPSSQANWLGIAIVDARNCYKIPYDLVIFQPPVVNLSLGSPVNLT